MRAFVLRQLLVFMAVVVGAALLLGLLLDVLPNAPSSAETPSWLRPVSLLFGLFTGEFGTAVSQNAAVGSLIAERLVVTLPLALLALVTTKLLGLGLGLLATRGRIADRLASAVALVLEAVPPFWLGMVLLLGLALGLKLLPAGGFVPWSSPMGSLGSLLLPALALGLPHAAQTALAVRRDFARGAEAQAIETRRARGETRQAAAWALGWTSVVQALPARLGREWVSILAGAAMVENVFYLPGLGRQILGAVAVHDLVLLRGSLFVMVVAGASLVLVSNLSRLLVDRELRK
ncbi:ABC transporter permease subunit [Devosia sp.]|uniref:ABC transporter permease subunit n=1 Tax=Devosia sp. TaxID=1871048 RepID=UPI003BA84E06